MNNMMNVSGGFAEGFLAFLGVIVGMLCIGLLFSPDLPSKMSHAVADGKKSIETSMEQGKAEISMAYEESKPGIDAALEFAQHPFR